MNRVLVDPVDGWAVTAIPDAPLCGRAVAPGYLITRDGGIDHGGPVHVFDIGEVQRVVGCAAFMRLIPAPDLIPMCEAV